MHTLPTNPRTMQAPTVASTLPRSTTPPLHLLSARSRLPRPTHRGGGRAAPTGPAATGKNKNPWKDPFDDGEDPDVDYNGLFAGGKQEEEPRPPDDPGNPYGFLRFPQGYNVELAGLASKLRGDVRRACCVVSGGVYENLLFFPAIQMVKERYPGVQVDVVTSARGKQVYEMSKYVRYANVYDPDDDWPEPDDYTNMIGVLKNRYYDLVLSTKVAGMGHALFLFMSSARDKVGYVYPNVNGAGAGLFLTDFFKPPTPYLSDGGYHMYEQMMEWIGRPARGVPATPVPPLKVSISKKLRAYVEDKYSRAGVEKGKYVVIHGVESDSVASMKPRGDDDCLLPIELWAQIAKEISYESKGVRPLFVIPHEKHRDDIEEMVGEDTNIIFITTPGQLASLINDSAGVVTTNTAAVQLANAREKPCVALFCSEGKARLFLPNVDEEKCRVISSKTGKLIDIDVEAVQKAVRAFEASPVFALV